MSAIPRTADWVTPDIPYFALANSSNVPGANIQVSTITLPITGSVILEGNTSNSAAVIFTQDPEPYMELSRKEFNTQAGTGFETIQAIGVSYGDPGIDQGVPFFAGEMHITGVNQLAPPNDAGVGVLKEDPDFGNGLYIGSYQSIRLDAPNVNISSITVSTINGQPYSAGGGTSGIFSTIFTSSIFGNTAKFSTINVQNFNPSSITVSTIYGDKAFFSTLNVSSINDSVITASTINTQVAQVASTLTNYLSTNIANAGTYVGQKLSTLTSETYQQVLSSLQFQFKPDVNFSPNIDLGMGGFLGGLAGGIGSGIFNTLLGGAALITGIIGLTNSRGNNTITSNAYEMINTTTQLQISTLGSAVSTFTRYNSTFGTSVFGKEVIYSTILTPGTVAIRSFSDPINLANPSTLTSTVQAYGNWVALPNAAPVTNYSTLSVSSLTVSSINGGSGGGGGGGNFDPNQISTVFQWYVPTTVDPFDPDFYHLGQFINVDQRISPTSYDNISTISSGVVVISTVSTVYKAFSTCAFRFQSGDALGTYPLVSDDIDGIANFASGSNTGSGFQYARLLTGDITLGSRWANNFSGRNNEVIIRNNFSSLTNVGGLAQIEYARISSIQNSVGAGNLLGYADIICGNIYTSTNSISSPTTGTIFTTALSTTNMALNGVVTTNFTVQSNATGQPGCIIAPQNGSNTYHNIGGVFLGYYGYGSAYLANGFQTGINAYVFNGGVGMSNGYINAYAAPGATPDSRINQAYFPWNAGMGGLPQVLSNCPPGSNTTLLRIYRPGAYMLSANQSSSDTGLDVVGYCWAFASYRADSGFPPGTLHVDFIALIQNQCQWGYVANDVAPGNNIQIVFYNNTSYNPTVSVSLTGLSYL